MLGGDNAVWGGGRCQIPDGALISGRQAGKRTELRFVGGRLSTAVDIRHNGGSINQLVGPLANNMKCFPSS